MAGSRSDRDKSARRKGTFKAIIIDYYVLMLKSAPFHDMLETKRVIYSATISLKLYLIHIARVRLMNETLAKERSPLSTIYYKRKSLSIMRQKALNPYLIPFAGVSFT